MAACGEEQRTLEDTSTWAVAVVCFFLVAISIFIEHLIHLTEKVGVLLCITQLCAEILRTVES